MPGLVIPGSDATAAAQDLIKTQTDKMPRLMSGAISILDDTETDLPLSISRVQSGVIEILDSVGNQTSGSIARVQSGVLEILDDTGVQLPASLERIQSGMIEVLGDTMSSLPSLITDLQKTVYGNEVVASGLELTGSSWLNVLEVNPVSYPTKLAGVTFSTSGNLIGTAEYRITDKNDVKLFPHVDENVLSSGTEDIFTHTIDVPNADGYKVQVRTTSVDDTSGKTVSLDQLNKIELV
jgi:hypothetical protein